MRLGCQDKVDTRLGDMSVPQGQQWTLRHLLTASRKERGLCLKVSRSDMRTLLRTPEEDGAGLWTRKRGIQAMRISDNRKIYLIYFLLGVGGRMEGQREIKQQMCKPRGSEGMHHTHSEGAACSSACLECFRTCQTLTYPDPIGPAGSRIPGEKDWLLLLLLLLPLLLLLLVPMLPPPELPPILCG